MVRSEVEVVGRLEPPPGKTWDDVITSPRERAALLMDFQLMSARALGLPVAQIQLHQRLWLGAAGERMRQEDWHRDAAKHVGHVTCVLGADPPEYLLGEYPERYLEDGADLGELVGQLELWRPESGELVKFDNRAVHRRPQVGGKNRLFLLAVLAD